MRALPLALVSLGIGCKEERVIPMWSDGILVEGDCLDDYEATNQTTVLTKVETFAADPLWHMDELPDPIGTVIRDQDTYHDLWVTMNFGSYPIVDFAEKQAVFVWARNTDTCGLSIDNWYVNTKADLGMVLDATFFDESMNCDSACGEDWKAMVMVAIDADVEASVCRRTRPGCEPDYTAR